MQKNTNLCAELHDDMKNMKSSYGAIKIDCYNNHNTIYYRYQLTTDGPFYIIPALKFKNIPYEDIEAFCPEYLV